MPKITFTVETAALPQLIVSSRTPDGGATNTPVPLSKTGADKFRGDLSIPPSRVLLTWIFVGSPGTKYSITLTPKSKVTLSRGENPIESQIATQETAGTGGVFVQVKS